MAKLAPRYSVILQYYSIPWFYFLISNFILQIIM